MEGKAKHGGGQGAVRDEVDLISVEAAGVEHWQRDNAGISLVGKWVAQGTTDFATKVSKLLAWNQLNDPPMGGAKGDPDARTWAQEKVRSVLEMDRDNYPDRWEQRSDEGG